MTSDTSNVSAPGQPSLAAAELVVTVPVLLLTIVIQKEIVAGLTHDGVKA